MKHLLFRLWNGLWRLVRCILFPITPKFDYLCHISDMTGYISDWDITVHYGWQYRWLHRLGMIT